MVTRSNRSIQSYALEPVVLEDITLNRRGTPRMYYADLDVDFVANDSVDVKNEETGEFEKKGICWASSSAAILNFKNGTNYTAMNIFNDVLALGEGTPVGSNTWYTSTFELYNYDLTIKRGMTFSQLYSQLSRDNPIIFGISSDVGKDTFAHAVVLKYMDGGTDYGTYGFMDPNMD